jgi:multimeric flavodoxin WrbA
MRTILMVYSTQTGRTRQLVNACRRGALQEPDTRVVRRRADAVRAADVLQCDAIVLGTPENFGYMAGLVKDFLDRIYYPLEERTIGLPYAVLVSCGNDGSGAVAAIERIVTGLRWRAATDPLVAKGEPTAAHLARAEEIGLTLSAGLSVGAL